MTVPSFTVPGQIKPPPKHIKVCGHKIHFRHIQTWLWIGILGFSAVLVASGIYYGVTQNVLKYSWDHLFTQAWWPEVRHLAGRGILEGILALPMVKWAAASWRKHWDHAAIPAWEVTLRLFAFLVVALALDIFAAWVITFGWAMAAHGSLHVRYTAPSAHAQEYLAIVIGLVIGQATHWIWRPAARTIQLHVAEATVRRWRRTGSPPVWEKHPLSPPTMRERAAWMMSAGVRIRNLAQESLYVRWAVPALAVVYLGLMVTGIYARYFAS